MQNSGSFRKNSQSQQVAQPFPTLGGNGTFVESAEVQALREEGNNLFRKGEYTQAIDVFTKALKLEPKNYLLWSNRSAAYISTKQFELALQDSDACLHYSPPSFLKVYMRKGAALFGLGHFEDALKAYRKAYADDMSNPAFTSKVTEIEACKNSTRDSFAQGAQKLREGCFAEALVLFNRAFEKMPHLPELNAYRNACQGCVDTNRPDASVCLSGTLLTLKRLKLKKRWFALQNTTFSYYNVNDMTKPPKFALSLFGARVTEVQGKEFCINGPSTGWPRVFRLKADSVEERIKWVNALQGAIASANCRVEVLASTDMNNIWTPWNTQNRSDRQADANWNGIGLA